MQLFIISVLMDSCLKGRYVGQEPLMLQHSGWVLLTMFFFLLVLCHVRVPNVLESFALKGLFNSLVVQCFGEYFPQHDSFGMC